MVFWNVTTRNLTKVLVVTILKITSARIQHRCSFDNHRCGNTI